MSDRDEARERYGGAGGGASQDVWTVSLAWAERVHQIAPEEPVHYYNLGCFYTNIGDRESALAALEKFGASGRGFRDWMEHDSDLDPLREDPRLQALMERFQEKK